MSEDRFANIRRGLGDRSYDKRKRAALELEAFVRSLQKAQQEDKIRAILEEMATSFAGSANSNLRKGGLIGMAAIAIALGDEVIPHLELLLRSVLSAFSDTDSRVRYYAAESLYNIIKVTRGAILPFIDSIFELLCTSFMDEDIDVKNGAQLLDRLVKEIVSEAEHGFDADAFVPLLERNLKRVNPYVRSLVIGWISHLDSLPHVGMLDYLPRFLNALIDWLSDGEHSIRDDTKRVLDSFLLDITPASLPEMDVEALVRILVSQCGNKDDVPRGTALDWLHHFVRVGGPQSRPLYPLMLEAVLHCSADQSPGIRARAAEVDADLVTLVKETEGEVDLDALVLRITRSMSSPHEPVRLAALRWVAMLLDGRFDPMLAFLPQLFPALCEALADDCDAVVVLDLQVLARLAHRAEELERVLREVVVMFARDRKLLERRGAVVLRNMCLRLDARQVLALLAEVLAGEADVQFAALMVQTLSLILLTAPELEPLRGTLRACGSDGEGGDDALFRTLFRCWSHSPVSTLALCLMCQAYGLAERLVGEIGETEATLGMLLEVDKLVHLIESPVFTHTRLQLIRPGHPQHAALLRTLYGLLMVLPQSTAFSTLHNRLQAVTSLHTALRSPSAADDESAGATVGAADEELLEHFRTVQAKHAEARRKALQEAELVGKAT